MCCLKIQTGNSETFSFQIKPNLVDFYSQVASNYFAARTFDVLLITKTLSV